MVFNVSILPKLELVTTVNSNEWYLDEEKTMEIHTKNFDNSKNDHFEIASELENIGENDSNVNNYIDLKLTQDTENEQKFYLNYKFSINF
ncbi:hypothetical protein [Mesoplasma melaleucae]|uniref:hypothetical protein n=1 Tax=Mesoplasma melaleucae TaxID=81459 RepID=UPI000487BA97|nr:hypothetical protein [Mesoplasma melaleucae]